MKPSWGKGSELVPYAQVMISFCEAVDADVTLMFNTPGA